MRRIAILHHARAFQGANYGMRLILSHWLNAYPVAAGAERFRTSRKPPQNLCLHLHALCVRIITIECAKPS